MSDPADPTVPIEEDPDTWQCCACDSLTEEDDIVTLCWGKERTAACPNCGHSMTWECCGGGRS